MHARFYSKLSFLVGDYCLTALAGPPDRNTPSEENMIEVYRTEAHRLNVVFSETAFNYAKAVSCLRLISIVRVSYKPATVFLVLVIMLIVLVVGGGGTYVM